MKTLPIDTTAITFLASSNPTPVLDFKTKQPKADGNGEPLYSVQLVAMQVDGADIITVKVPGQPAVRQGTTVKVIGLVALPWETNGRNGIAFRAARVEALSPATKAN